MKFLLFAIFAVIIGSSCAAVVPVSESYEGEAEANNGIREITCLLNALLRINIQIPDFQGFVDDVKNTLSNIRSSFNKCQESSGIQQSLCLANSARLVIEEKRRLEKRITDQVDRVGQVWIQILEAHRVCLN